MHDVVAEAVDFRTLLVHHVVILERALADLEMVFLDVLLCLLDGWVEHPALKRLALLHAFLDIGKKLVAAGEQPEQVVLEREKKVGGTFVTLPGATAAQLTVDAARLVPLGGDDVQPADRLDAFAKLDVGAPAGHVGGDSHRPLLPGACNDLGLLLVVFGVEYTVDDTVFLEHPGDQLADLNRHGADEHRAALSVDLLDLVEHGVVLLTARFEDGVIGVLADARLMGGDGEHA